MATISIVKGRYGQLFLLKEQDIEVFGRPHTQKHDTMIPAFAIEEFNKSMPKGKIKKIKLAFLLLGKYNTPITIHTVGALISTVGEHIAENTVSKIAKEQGLRQHRHQGTVFYEGIV